MTRIVRRSSALLAAAAFASAAFVLPSAQAVNVTWVGANNGFWDIAGNWNPALPGVADDAQLGAFNTEFRSGTVTIHSLTGTGNLTISGGVLSISAASSIGALALTGGTLGGTGTLTASGASTWTNGGMSGTGTTVFNGPLAISTDNVHTLSGHAVTTNGTTTWTNGGVGNAGLIEVGQGAVINNAGTWLDQTAFNSQIGLFFGGTAAFNNTGTYTKSGNATTNIGAAFNNTSSGPGTGVVNVNAGTLSLTGGGTSNGLFQGAGTLSFGGTGYTLSAGSNVSTTNVVFAAGTTTVGGAYNVSGTTTASGGTANFTGTVANVGGALVGTAGALNFNNSAGVTVSSLTLSGATISGSQTLTVTGPSTWTSGGFSGTGTTVFNGALAISTDNVHTLSGYTLATNGTTTWTNGGVGNAGLIEVGQGAVINNAGTWLDQTAFNSQIGLFFGGTAAFNNTGTYTKSGNATTNISAAFNNTSSGPGTGVVNVNAGTLSLTGGGTSNGKFDVAAGATLNFGGGTHNLSGVVAGAGTGQMLVSAGTVNATGNNAFGGQLTDSGGTLNVTGAFSTNGLNLTGGTLGGTGTLTAGGASTWTNGGMSGTGHVVFNGPLAISTDNVHTLSGFTVATNGTTTWTNGGVGNAGLIEVGQGAVINNAGTWLDQTAFNSQIGLFFGGTAAFNNTGTYTKSGNATTNISAAFNNTSSGPGTGVVNVNAGTLSLTGGGTSNGLFQGAGTLSFGGTGYTLSAGSNVSTTNVVFAAGTTTVGGAYNVSGTTTASGGTANFTGTVANVGGALVGTAGALNFNNSAGVTVSSLTLSGATISGSQTLTVTGPSTWTSGGFSGTGTTVFNGALAISTDNVHTLSGYTLATNGTTTWTNGGVGNAGLIEVGQGAVINNAGTWLDQTAFNSQIGLFFGGTAAFNNTGTYTKSGNATTNISAAFNNTSSGPGTGVVNVNAGTLSLTGGGTSNGKFDVAAGATLNFGGGTHNLSGVVAGAGTGQMLVSAGTVNATGNNAFGGQLTDSGGTLNVTGAFSTNGLNLTGGTLGGTGTLTAGGASTWTNGGMSGTGHVVFNGPLAISTDNVHTLSGFTVATNGTTTWTNGGVGNAGLIEVGQGAVINNAGTWLDQTAFNSQIGLFFGGTAAFNNTGTYTKSGNATTNISAAFNNTSSGPGTGVVNVNAGTLSLTGGGTSNGKFDVAAGATLNFGGGTHNLSGVVAGAGTGQMLVSAGTVNATGNNAFGGQLTDSGGTLNVTGAFSTNGLNLTGGTIGGVGTLTASGTGNWTGGTMTDAGTTNFNGPLAISTDGVHAISGGHILTLNGTTTWTNGGVGNAGLIETGGGAVINNVGTWLDQLAFNSQIFLGFGGTATFNNTGTYTKSGSSTTTVGIAFNNTGLLDVQAGRLILNDVGGLQGNGALRIGAAGAVTASSGNDTVSTFTHQGGAGSFDIGTHTLTVSADYNNANFGTGNAFNRRTNVTTTGAGNRIIASGDVNQGVSGVGIANGTGSSPTLTLGNVHVGGSTFNYNIANTGTTGPALRGAIQTSINGAALTDARLSGSGVTAGNWGPIVAGTNLSRDVTLTIGAAGIYAPLSGQSVNILNNFDNTRSQLVAINSSAGAAAYNLASANVIAPVNFGVVHVGDTVSQALTISNTAAAGAFSEKLNASFGGTSDARILTSGSIGLLAAGSTNNTSMLVGLNTAAAGVVTGTATVLLQSDGTGTSGLGITGLPSQLVGVSGDIQTVGQVFRLAQPSFHTPEPVSFGNVRVGAATNQNLSLTNLAANDGFSEKLNASIGGATAGVTAGGAFNLLAAQATNNSSLHVGIDTTTAGAKAGTATITLVSDGTGTSGLGQTALPSQTVNVSGNVYRLASASAHIPEPVVFGNQRVGGSAMQFVSLTNTAANDGFSEKLNASIGGATGSVSASGSFTLLGAGASNNSALSVGVDTATAGAKSGTATITLASDGTGTSGFSALNIGSQVVNVAGNVYNVAAGLTTPSPIVFSNRHVGDVATQVLTVANTATAGAFSEALNAAFSGTTGNATTNGGTAINIAAGANNSTSLSISLNTGAAGARSGTATISYQSDGTGPSGNSGLAAIAAGSQVLNISGNVYRLASANTIGAVNFGVVHVGDTVSQALTLTNTAANDGFSEKLNASFGGTTDARILTSGSISQLGAGATNNSSLLVGLNTAAAGVVSGTATVLLQSDGTGTSGLGITGLPSQAVGVTGDIQTVGQVFRLAQPSFHTPEPVSFGNVRVGTATNQNLSLTNLAANDGFSEKLNASIGGASAGVTAGGAFNLLAAQATNNTSLHVGIDTSSAGARSGTATITLVSDGTGTSGLGLTALPSQTVNVSGNVYNAAFGAATPAPVVFANRHVGDVATQVLTIGNTAAAGAFSEALNAAFAGSTGSASNNGGSVTNIAAGSSNSAALSVGLSTSAAGARSGTVTVAFQSDGTGSNGNSGLAAIAAGSQVINISGNVYNLASANVIAPVSFGVVHVGDTVSQALTISNTAAAGAFSEKLNASFGGTSDTRILTSGSIGLLAAGSTNNTSMLVGLNTGAPGVVTGTATVLLQSDGTGTSGLGITGLPSQLVGVSGDVRFIVDVFRLAQPSFHTPEPVSFGNVRVGTATNQNLSLTNLAANDGFSEKLNASIGGATAGVTAGGAFNLLAAQATNNSSLHVGIDTTTAGAKAGTATITLVSDGTGTSGLGQTALPSQTVNISGNVYRLANPTLGTPAVALAARVGDAAPTRSITITNTSPDGFTERLNASIGAGPAGFTTSGSVNGLVAGASSNALAVSLNTASAASLSGTAAIAFVSSGVGTTNAAEASVGSQNVSLTGHVYAPAVDQLNTNVVDFGVVHRGDVVAARNVSVTNSATSAALNDTLVATLAGGAAPFGTSGAAAGIVAGGTNASTLNATLNTANTGSFASNATVTFVSHDAELADLSLGSSAVTLKGQVNDFAKVGLAKSGGAGSFSGGATSYTLDFGTLLLGSGSLASSLTLSNAVVGLADLLSGSFDLSGVHDFGLSGFNSFTGLGAGDSLASFSVTFAGTLLGHFDESIFVHAQGSNASGYNAALDDVQLHLVGNVTAITNPVPEPETYLLMMAGLVALGAVARRRKTAGAARLH